MTKTCYCAFNDCGCYTPAKTCYCVFLDCDCAPIECSDEHCDRGYMHTGRRHGRVSAFGGMEREWGEVQ